MFFKITGVNDAPFVNVILKPRPKLKNAVLPLNFNEVLIKNRGSVGNVVTKFPIHKIVEADAPKGAKKTPQPEIKLNNADDILKATSHLKKNAENSEDKKSQMKLEW